MDSDNYKTKKKKAFKNLWSVQKEISCGNCLNFDKNEKNSFSVTVYRGPQLVRSTQNQSKMIHRTHNFIKVDEGNI